MSQIESIHHQMRGLVIRGNEFAEYISKFSKIPQNLKTKPLKLIPFTQKRKAKVRIISDKISDSPPAVQKSQFQIIDTEKLLEKIHKPLGKTQSVNIPTSQIPNLSHSSSVQKISKNTKNHKNHKNSKSGESTKGIRNFLRLQRPKSSNPIPSSKSYSRNLLSKSKNSKMSYFAMKRSYRVKKYFEKSRVSTRAKTKISMKHTKS